MRRGAGVVIIGIAIVGATTVAGWLGLQPGSGAARQSGPGSAPLASITVDYPEDGSVFPPEITAPTFLWRDAAGTATAWIIDVEFQDGSAPIRGNARGEPLRIGEVDRRAMGETNEAPKLTPQQAAARSWIPDAAIWAAIKQHSVARPATVTITGIRERSGQAVSRGQVAIQTSKDPLGAPIFYRDVPLMPSELEKGVIKPLARKLLPLVGWRLRNVGEPRSRLLMEGLHTCANCHSFSRDGKTLGIDMDGPANDKGIYAIAPIVPRMSIRNQDVITLKSFREKSADQMRIGFMSQVSPDGQYLVTMVKGAVYVANFKDYRFLQVFYPTRGILAWYSRATGRWQALPGADDPRYVNTNAVWSPDGRFLVFARAEAKEPYPEGRRMPEYPNDPNEVQMQYDLYRISFDGGRGGRPEAIAGASRNGMSNAFPKISPDGRWIVFVQCRNGELMRPDSQLYIVPVEGGQARRMRCNTSLMNSWHSFSPNGRWLVFSSKSRSPYTQMFLTHLDDNGRDTPAILIDNATAANRAVNIPEFLNIPQNGLLRIDAPAAELYRLFDSALELEEKGQFEAAIAEWKKALEIDPTDAKTNNNFGRSLIRKGSFDEAIGHFRKALEVEPDDVQVHNNLAIALAGKGRLDEAVTHWLRAIEVEPKFAQAQDHLGIALVQKGRFDEAIAHFRKALEIEPKSAKVHNNLGIALFEKGALDEAMGHWQSATEIDPGFAQAQNNLGVALGRKERFDEAIAHFRKALEADPGYAEVHNSLGIALAATGELDEAIAHWRKAAQIEPRYAEAYFNLGRTLAVKGEFKEAISNLEKALELNPQYAEADYRLGDTLYSQGRIPEAVAHWLKGLRVQPDYLPVLNRTAWVLATYREASVRNGAQAVQLAERAVRLSSGREPAILDTMAAAYAEVGRFPEAAEIARRALVLATERNERPLIDALRARIALYNAETPFREMKPPPPSHP